MPRPAPAPPTAIGAAALTATAPSGACTGAGEGGWTFQPDVNPPVYLTVTAVDTQNNTFTARGHWPQSLRGQNTVLPGGAQGGPMAVPRRWRIFAPPGTVTVGPAAGCVAAMVPHRQAHWVNAVSTRCLYKGYRYETPLAGVQGSEPGSGITHRQDGLNFGGLYYTLWRHYDPVLMRFTTPDPLAAPFYNLFHYAANNPAAFYDPDGLSKASEWLGNWLRRQGQDDIDRFRAEGQLVRAGVNEGIRNVFAGLADVGSAFLFGGYDFTNWLTTGEEMALTKIASGLSNRWEQRQETLSRSDAPTVAKVAGFIVLSGGDLIGATQIFVEGAAGINSVTGERMTPEQRGAAAGEGGLILAGWGAGSRGLPTRGGPYSRLRARGGERNHMPAKQGIASLKHDGPAIVMRGRDHTFTASHPARGKTRSSAEYRAQQRSLIEQGRFREAQMMDIRDIRSKFGGRYDRHIAEMLRYTDLYLRGRGHKWPVTPSSGPRLPVVPHER
jgi:RHS repeat-associated protein